MQKQLLNGEWQLRIIGENVYGISDEPIKAEVPGSVYGTLLKEGLIPDPYYRDNELTALKLMDNDFEYSLDFDVSQEMLNGDVLFLNFAGIDTLADIYLNDMQLGYQDDKYTANNMHRAWKFNLTASDLLLLGRNHLRVVLYSPVKYIRAENEKVFVGGSGDAMKGYPHLRKAHCMFGWDWGPRLPDAGIYRDVTLVSYKNSRIDSVYITQVHQENKVLLDFDVVVELLADTSGHRVIACVVPPNENVSAPSLTLDLTEDTILEIPNPQLWWPNGYGEQPLYKVLVKLLDLQGNILDIWEKRIGLRTMTVNTDPDEWGNRFAHEVNGVQIFAMGADYIPEDNILSRVTSERTERLLKDAVEANYNIIRVWGGGYYPNDFFYDFCDELGLIVWQDFMYACANYELTEDFEINIIGETIDVIRRLRHHACLGIWCGNNEMESQMIHKSWKPSIKQKYDYIKIFEYIIPRIVKTEDPATFYWASSPSSGGNYDDPDDENRGDAHYWMVWHGNEPLTAYRNHYFRYLSEFGFQSFPAIKTIESFTEPEDRNIFSYVMEMHQRNCSANGKIMNYLSATYRYPTDFECLIYASQLLQAEAMRNAIEHNRRHRGRCMGTVVWQLNDIWPVASWASIDYYGRWKALHYIEKRAFSKVLISCEEIGEVTERPYPIAEPKPYEKSARLHVANETREEVSGTVHWSINGSDGLIVNSTQGKQSVTVLPLSGLWLEKIDLADYNEREVHINFYFEKDGQVLSSGTCLFTPPKYYHFADPELTVTVNGKMITVKSKAYAKNVEISAVDGDVWLSDNYFDMEAGEVDVVILRGEASEFRVRSVYDI
ncbi:MAG: glycoside hydrolase family 2 protein [Lachnospiraceae bacterium]|nr:glycoside hydrolase family 2 protein [Lachnospiraceae bacterium]